MPAVVLPYLSITCAYSIRHTYGTAYLSCPVHRRNNAHEPPSLDGAVCVAYGQPTDETATEGTTEGSSTSGPATVKITGAVEMKGIVGSDGR